MVYVPRDDHGRLLRVEYQPFVGITDNQYTDLPEAARNKLDEQALALAHGGFIIRQGARMAGVMGLHQTVKEPSPLARPGGE